MGYILKDSQAPSYHELWDVVLGAVRPAGFGVVVEDVFGFFLTASTSVTDEVCYIYDARQVEVDKLVGTGQEINVGQRVYATLGSLFQSVTGSPVGVIGTDYYFVGWCKREATASDTKVLIRFDGKYYNHADMD